jgi:hypothetical protein
MFTDYMRKILASIGKVSYARKFGDVILPDDWE